MWTLYYAPAASAGIRRIPRGPAAEVTAAIGALQQDPMPFGVFPEPLGKLNSYVLLIGDYAVTYEIIQAGRIIRILTIE
jgi:hypothetical protein